MVKSHSKGAQLHAPSKDHQEEIAARWRRSIDFYKKRSPIVFVSDPSRFWEPHGFVQQSLARTLTAEGIDVIWLDGRGSGYKPTVRNGNSHLTVRAQNKLPGERFRVVEQLGVIARSEKLKRITRNGKSMLWVQSGLNDRVAERLPKIDVYSIFDDPYLHRPEGALMQKAQVVTCQNTFVRNLLAPDLGNKVKHLLPPVDLDFIQFPNKTFSLPESFPDKVMGFIGSCFPVNFDFSLLENFVQSLPQWGFVLAGRTDELGLRFIDRLKVHTNFVYYPWVPREKVAGLWELLDVSIFLYRPWRDHDGAFPVKTLESLQHGVPVVATSTHKTADLGEAIPRVSFAHNLKFEAQKAADRGAAGCQELFEHFYFEMHPKKHLSDIAEWLS